MEYQFDTLALQALCLMEKTLHNLFLTGKAGTGKSTLLHSFMRNTTKKVVVLAPT
jgi:DNA replication protein DnaC